MDTIKKFLISIFVVSAFAHFAAPQVSAESVEVSSPPALLCMPGIYLEENPECSVLGPAAYLTRQAHIYAQIDSQPERFPYLDTSYGETDYYYFRARNKSSAVFSTYQAAVNNSGAVDSLPEGYTFAAYTRMVEENGNRYYQLTNGYWMRHSAVSSYAAPSRFLGNDRRGQAARVALHLSYRPEERRWVLREIPTQEKPGFYEPLTGNRIERYSLIEVFDEVQIGSSTWYMIAPDEWVHNTQVGLVYPAEHPPEGVTNGRWIEINIWEQTLAVYENEKMIFATLVTTGSKDFYSRPGLFKIYEKLESTHMAGYLGKEEAYYLMNVPWTMYFDDGRGTHAEYWHDHLGYRSSHGCINMSFPDAEWLFRWARMDEWVYAWDPSGSTPEDPRLFTQFLNDS